MSLFEYDKILYNQFRNTVAVGLLKSFFYLPQNDEENALMYSAISKNDIDFLQWFSNKITEIDSEKFSLLRRILSDTAQIYETLLPMTQKLGLIFEFALVGGAVRDFLLGREIKDLDIIFALHAAKGFSHDYSMDAVSDKFFKENPQIEQQIKSLNLPPLLFNEDKKTSYIEQFFFHVVSETLKRKWSVVKEHEPHPVSPAIINKISTSNILANRYQNFHLRGVVKIEDRKLNYPVDVLICNTTVSNYVKNFDFGICQTYLPLSDNLINLLHYCSHEKIEAIVKDIKITQEFLKDVKNQKLTLNADGFSLEMAEASLINHYPRLQKKYENYQLECSHYDDKTISKQVKDYIKSYVLYKKLNKILPTKEQSKEMKQNIRKTVNKI